MLSGWLRVANANKLANTPINFRKFVLCNSIVVQCVAFYLSRHEFCYFYCSTFLKIAISSWEAHLNVSTMSRISAQLLQ